MSPDLAATLRKRKPARHRRPLVARPSSGMPDWTDLPGGGPRALLLATNVYINRAAGRLAPELREAIDRALLFHSSVALAELATGVAHADPGNPGWPALRDYYLGLFAVIPPTRVVTPTAQTWTDAGVIAGTLARTQGFQPHQRRECLNDALIVLSAAQADLPVPTANRAEFDLIRQLAPKGQDLPC